jgi:branched-chain amino acid transport system substrate-binding protein
MKKKGFLAAPLAIATVVLATACGGNANQAGSDGSESSGGGTIKIGVSGPLTGANTSWGTAMTGGATIAAEEIRDSGGIKVGNQVYNFEVVPYDDKFSPAGATSAVSRMISQDGIKFIFGPTTGAATAAVQPTIESNKVLQIQSGFGAVVSADYDYSFRTVLTPNEYCKSWYRWISEKRTSVKKVALVGPNDVVGQGSVKPCEAAADAAGISHTSYYYERSEQDYSSLVAKILADRPDSVDLTGGAPGEAAGIIKQLRQSGYTGLTMKSGGAATKTIIDIAGNEVATGHLYFEQVSTSSPDSSAFLKTFADRYQSSGEQSIAILYHDSVKLLALAIEAAKSVDAAKVRDAMSQPFSLPLIGDVTWGGSKTYGAKNQMLNTGSIVEWNGKTGQVVGQLDAVSP